MGKKASTAVINPPSQGGRASTRWAARRFRAARLYCITCSPVEGQTYESMVEAACLGGADVIQFRDKNLLARDLLRIGSRLKTICAYHRVLFIVNDRPDVAAGCGADGVHLGQEDGPLARARQMVGTNRLIGRSTHGLEQALAAQKEGADYVAVGPIFATPTKPDYLPVGLSLLKEVLPHLKIPAVAIGGIDGNNVREVLQAGAERVAVVRAVCGSPDVEAAARRLKELILNTLNHPEPVEGCKPNML